MLMEDDAGCLRGVEWAQSAEHAARQKDAGGHGIGSAERDRRGAAQGAMVAGFARPGRLSGRRLFAARRLIDDAVTDGGEGIERGANRHRGERGPQNRIQRDRVDRRYRYEFAPAETHDLFNHPGAYLSLTSEYRQPPIAVVNSRRERRQANPLGPRVNRQLTEVYLG